MSTHEPILNSNVNNILFLQLLILILIFINLHLSISEKLQPKYIFRHNYESNMSAPVLSVEQSLVLKSVSHQ